MVSDVAFQFFIWFILVPAFEFLHFVSTTDNICSDYVEQHIAFSRKSPTMTLNSIPLKNKIQKNLELSLHFFFVVATLNYPKDDTVFSRVCVWENKANLEVFAEELKIFMHAHVLSAATFRTSKQTELSFCKLYFEGKCRCIKRLWVKCMAQHVLLPLET